MASRRLVVAAFDFDGTLTSGDTLGPFLRQVAGLSSYYRHLMELAPTLTGFRLGLLSRSTAKERVLVRFLGNRRLTDLEALAEEFARERLPGMLRDEAVARVRWHKTQGHLTVLASASLELYLQYWARTAGFDHVLATRLDVSGQTVTGKILGANCYGPEKRRRLDELLGARPGYRLYAYGDSRGDKDLLDMADHAYFREMPDGDR